MSDLIARNCRVEVSTLLGSALAITALTKANPGVATSAGHGLSNGDVVVFRNMVGMEELEDQVVRVASVTTDTFALEGIDTSDFGTFEDGDAFEATTWKTLFKVQTVERGSASADRKSSQVLLDKRKRYVYGAPEDPELTMNGLSDLNSESIQYLEKVAGNIGIATFRLTLINQGAVRVFRGMPTTPSESFNVDELVTSGFSAQQIGRYMAYAS